MSVKSLNAGVLRVKFLLSLTDWAKIHLRVSWERHRLLDHSEEEEGHESLPPQLVCPPATSMHAWLTPILVISCRLVSVSTVFRFLATSMED